MHGPSLAKLGDQFNWHVKSDVTYQLLTNKGGPKGPLNRSNTHEQTVIVFRQSLKPSYTGVHFLMCLGVCDFEKCDDNELGWLAINNMRFLLEECFPTPAYSAHSSKSSSGFPSPDFWAVCFKPRD